MATMTDEQIQEIIKSFAYGMEVEEIADLEELTTDELEQFEKDHASEIEEKKASLEEGEFIE